MWGDRDLLEVVDLFCGAGGVTEGILNSNKAKVTHAVNHSDKAIEAHSTNNPDTIHFQENIEDLDVSKLPRKTNILWASAECTHHSIAKGGQSRDADSRSLADYLDSYVDQCNPDFFMVENVKEFLNWGPVIPKLDKHGNIMFQKTKKGYKLDENGNKMPVMVPDKTRLGEYYDEWVDRIKNMGYKYEYRLLNSADYGAHTSRTRYFGVFYKLAFKWKWPEPTHAKDPGESGLERWKACREKIDLTNEGVSIFGRSYNMSLPKNLRRPLVEATQKRIAEGIKKFALDDFIAKAYGGTQKKNGIDLSPTVTSLDDPLHTIPTRNTHAKVSIIKEDKFIAKSYGAGGQQSPIDEPLHTITTKDRHALISIEKSHFLSQILHGSMHNMSIDEPSRVILTEDEKQLVTVEPGTASLDEKRELEKRQFIVRHFGNAVYTDLDGPLGSITCDKKDTLITVDLLCKIIKDVKMRYLTAKELADITGFNENTYLGKTETVKKHHVGNAVPPVIPEALANAAHDCLKRFSEEALNVA